MKKLLLLLMVATFTQMGSAQFNVTLVSQVSYNLNLNDLWGYVAPDGTEYALVGVNNGVSIVSLADPANPLEVAFVPGASSTWRDIKTWDTYAYCTNETGGGLAVIDLSGLPNSVSSYDLTDLSPLGTVGACHNIWMDEFGYAYLCGCAGLASGGAIYLDCFTDPANPTYVGNGPNIYSHDIYTRDNIMYTSDIYDGVFSIYDVADKSNTVFLGSQATDFNFTHNAWLNDAGDVLFTTDEVGDAPVGSYDISDPTDIQLLDLFKPLASLGEGVSPHNVHVFQDWLIISYYEDGCIIVDGSNPGNLIEVGNFDTFIGNNGLGVWGAYPYLPSGLILLSDVSDGMFVLQPNYVRACWLEGKVTNSLTSAPLNGATIDIIASQLNTGTTDAIGNYESGIATAGTYDVVYAAPGYTSKTISTTLENGVLTIQDVELDPPLSFAANGQVIDEATGAGVPDALVEMVSSDFTFTTTADSEGNFTLPAVPEGDYDAFAGKWGYQTNGVQQSINGGPANFTIEITRGYRDEFALDLGWTVDGNAVTGIWERGEPIGTATNNGTEYNPDFDLSTDLGDKCFMTGNGGGGVGDDDVDDGNTVLTSPVMDLTIYIEAELSFHAWFANGGGGGDPNDALTVTIDNGLTSVLLETIDQNTDSWNGPYTYVLTDFIDITDNMTVSFETADDPNSGHLVEAAIDLFEISGTIISNTFDISDAFELTATPNPFREVVTVQYELPENVASGKLTVYNLLGQQLSQTTLAAGSGTIVIDDILMKGIYLIQIEADGFASQPVKVMKAE